LRIASATATCTGSRFFISDDQAAATLLANLDGKPQPSAVFLRFTTGRRRQFWNKNCIALDSRALSRTAGVHQHSFDSKGLTHLLNFFPDRNCAPVVAENSTGSPSTNMSASAISSFFTTRRQPTARAAMESLPQHDNPDELAYKIRQFRGSGRVGQVRR